MMSELWSIKKAAEWADLKYTTLVQWRCRYKGNPKYDFPIVSENPVRVDSEQFKKWFVEERNNVN